MPDRNTREKDRAFQQRFGQLDKQVRDLRLRAWTGALRTAKSESAMPTVYNTYVQTLSLLVPSGRWEIHAEVTFTVEEASGAEDFYLGVDLLDKTTGAQTGTMAITARRCAPAATAGAFLAIPVVLIDDFAAEIDTIVSLKTRNAGANAYTVGGPRLLVLPV